MLLCHAILLLLQTAWFSQTANFIAQELRHFNVNNNKHWPGSNLRLKYGCWKKLCVACPQLENTKQTLYKSTTMADTRKTKYHYNDYLTNLLSWGCLQMQNSFSSGFTSSSFTLLPLPVGRRFAGGSGDSLRFCTKEVMFKLTTIIIVSSDCHKLLYSFIAVICKHDNIRIVYLSVVERGKV